MNCSQFSLNQSVCSYLVISYTQPHFLHVKLHVAACKTVMQLQSLHTVGQHSKLAGLAKGALGADVHVDGSEAEVVPGVVWLCFGKVHVPCYLRHKPAAIILLDEVGKFVDKPAVGQSWRGDRVVKITLISNAVGTYWVVLNAILPAFRFQYGNS